MLVKGLVLLAAVAFDVWAQAARGRQRPVMTGSGVPAGGYDSSLKVPP